MNVLPVILKVLSEPKVIIAAVICFILMDFASYVCRYRKKPARPKIKKSAAPAPAPSPAAGSSDGEGNDE